MSFPSDLPNHFEAFFTVMFAKRPEREPRPHVENSRGQLTSPVVHAECHDLLAEINRLRAITLLGPVKLRQVEVADQLATGHVDFRDKLRRYVIDLTNHGKLDRRCFY
jgi:hypothetical protein